MSTVHLGEADSGKDIALRVGDHLVIALGENPTTGYGWAIDRGAASVLGDASALFHPPPVTAAGGGGVRQFAFNAENPGEGELRLKLWRDWEGDRSITQRFAVRLSVR
jgi:inhibitor of cysteine peptidase